MLRSDQPREECLLRKLITALLGTLIIIGPTFSVEPYHYREIPNESFKPVEILVDPLPEEKVIPRPESSLNEPEIIIVEKPKTPKPKKASNSITGVASWYCLSGVSRCTVGHSGGYYAAIRRDLLELRGKTVLVCSSGGCVKVKIIDCNCGPKANLIDLYYDAFNAIGNPSMGRMKVTLKW